MKNAKGYMLIGAGLIALQLLGIMGNALAGEMPSFDEGLLFLLGYFSIGIIGVCVLIQGIRKIPDQKNDDTTNKKDDSDSDKKE